MKTCTHCGNQAYREESRFCLKCGNQLPEREDGQAVSDKNICTNPDCDWRKTNFIYPDDARFCDACGSATVFAKQN